MAEGVKDEDREVLPFLALRLVFDVGHRLTCTKRDEFD
jgi:hypothetical protein